MQIEQFRYARDNFSYLVHLNGQGVVIDGGAVEEILTFLTDHGITLQWVTNTHMHPDHIPGNQALLDKTGASFVDPGTAAEGQLIDVGGKPLEIKLTPGHTLDSVCFSAPGFLITGDTLFNGTVGNCFSGDLKAFFISLKKIMEFPPTTRIYAGHDYVKDAMAYARIIEPGNADRIQAVQDRYDPALVVSTLAEEMAVNPYLRFNAPSMVDNLKARGVCPETAYDRFKAIMEIY